jgi:hypothetical protein
MVLDEHAENRSNPNKPRASASFFWMQSMGQLMDFTT